MELMTPTYKPKTDEAKRICKDVDHNLKTIVRKKHLKHGIDLIAETKQTKPLAKKTKR